MRNPYQSDVGSWRGPASVAVVMVVAGCGSTGSTAVSTSEAETAVETSSTPPAVPIEPNALGPEVGFTGDGLAIRIRPDRGVVRRCLLNLLGV